MEARTFTHAGLGVALTVRPFTQRMLERFAAAYQKFRGAGATRDEQRGAMLRAALESGWIVVEPPLTVEAVDEAGPRLVRWLVEGRGSQSLTALYLEATTIPPE
jgi:hypothetical protein